VTTFPTLLFRCKNGIGAKDVCEGSFRYRYMDRNRFDSNLSLRNMLLARCPNGLLNHRDPHDRRDRESHQTAAPKRFGMR
jgi:hypothetical protein